MECIIHSTLECSSLLRCRNAHQPIRIPRVKPATNDALPWKSAVRKSMIQRKREPTFGGLFAPVTGSFE